MVVNEIRRYILSILDVNEVRWLGFGRVRPSKGEVIFCAPELRKYTTEV